ncbi:MAG: circadian clock protein KaiC [Methanosarcinaceae archaeon]|nr:circadian clock protein KaiC [Methanosarcinaceae archaeon]
MYDSPLQKSPTGIEGVDDITLGGLPTGRSTLVCGGTGCGKTLFGIEFLVNGAVRYGEPGVLITFEETPDELNENVESLGIDLKELEAQKKIYIDYVYIEPSEIEESGDYDLEGLFIRIGHAIDSVGAKRIVLDTIESLFSGLPNKAILRAELHRLFRFLKNKGVTAVITGERADGTLTRHGLEEYISDCVILLDQRVENQLSVRRMRIIKYRGSLHGMDEYPFLIDDKGISVLPITSLEMEHDVSTERISTGIEGLDAMLGGGGYYKGSTIMISGTAGTGKTSIAASFARAACERGERCLYLAYEEAESQIIRNMHSIGLDLEPCINKGLLKIKSSRSTRYGLEMHLVMMHQLVNEFKPDVVVIDPITDYKNVGKDTDVKSMLTRFTNLLKAKKITILLTDLAHTETIAKTAVNISSLVDTWLLLRDIESNGERNRGIYILKSRGMAHSNHIREFRLTDEGIDLVDMYVGPGGMLTGSARYSQEALEKAEELVSRQEMEHKQRELERKRKILDARIIALQAEFEAEEEEINKFIMQREEKLKVLSSDRDEISKMGQADQRT